MASPLASSKFQISDGTNATEEEERASRLLIGTSNSTICSGGSNGKDVQGVDLFQQYVEDQRRTWLTY